MAPSNGGGRGQKPAGSSTSARPNIIPAIPLPLVKKPRAAIQHSSPCAVAAPVSAASFSPESSPRLAPRLAETPKPFVDDSNNHFADHEGDAAAGQNPTEPSEPAINQSSTKPEPGEADEVVTQIAEPGQVTVISAAWVPPTTSSTGESRDNSKESATPSSSSVRQEPGLQQPAPSPGPVQFAPRPEVETAPNAMAGKLPDTAEQMTRLSMSGPPQIHQPQQSNGTLVFGDFPDSNTASPAPPSGGIYPPAIMPFQPDTIPVALDPYGRPMLTSPTMDGFPPPGAYHGTSTPHSFHGSQASFQAEENGQGQYTLANGHTSYAPRPMPPTPFSASLDPRLSGPFPVAGAADSLDTKMHEAAVVNLQQSFGELEFADSFLEVRLPNSRSDDSGERGGNRDGQSAPLRIPSHRFILAKSPSLRRRLRSHGTNTDGTLLLFGDDKYLRADALYYAIRTLYGSPLGAVLPTYVQLKGIKDQFDLALGYASAGRFFQLDLVLYKGIRSASRLVAWETLEKAFEYALPGFICPYSPSGSESSPTYPRTPDVWASAVREILNSAVAFIIHNFPKDFVLDMDSGVASFGRLPSALQSGLSPNAPPIAHGSYGSSTPNHSRQTSTSSLSAPQMPFVPNARPSRNSRLMNIKFGDLSPPTVNGTSGSTSPRLRPTPVDSLFSRVLLHLPFNLLKDILEDSSLGSVAGGVTLHARHRVMAEIVQERETRRGRAVESLRQQSGPLYHFYKSRVSSVEPQPVDGDSDYKANNLSLREEVVQGGPDGPYLAQSWHRYEFGEAL